MGGPGSANNHYWGEYPGDPMATIREDNEDPSPSKSLFVPKGEFYPKEDFAQDYDDIGEVDQYTHNIEWEDTF